MASLHDLRERLRKPLLLELQSGCRDTAVVGGLEKLVATVGRPFADVQEAIAGYSALEPQLREARLQRALELLSGNDGTGPGKAVAVAADAAPAESKAVAMVVDEAPPPTNEEVVGDGSLQATSLDGRLDERLVELGAQAARKLGAVGVSTYRDLLYHLPRRYEDRRALPHFGMLRDGEAATVTGSVVGRKAQRARKGMNILRVFLEDAHGGRITAVWFNQPWLEKSLFPGQRLIVTGKVKLRGRRAELSVQHMEIDDEGESLSAGRIVGIYPSTQGLSQAYLRRAVHRLLRALERLPDHLPRSVLERFSLVPLDRALREIHFPRSESDLAAAVRRLKFDEFLFLELRVLLNRDPGVVGRRFEIREGDLATFEASLPFSFTEAQRRALREILDDMAGPRQMARLLQGDVGSGKTVVAAAAIYLATRNGSQAALMAPTEILARQHYLNLREYLYPLGVRSELLLGTMGVRERREARERVASGEAQLAVGTHALIQEGVSFADLGLAVIDEEHRFGVEQRRRLLQGAPDVLVMSATPIPRSLALTYYGDLELSIIDALPPGRQPIATRLVNDSKRREVYRFAWGEIRKGRQVYLVTPLIEESEALDGIVATTQIFEDLKVIMPPACRIGMLHGRMPADEKEAVMEAFRRHELDMLVSTTVIEVGVDIPNATVMIIENAERFGLSQLHQLRGRVGRGEHQSTCVLVAGDRSRKTQQRLEVVERHADGFVIAEKDLELRGPGELRGTRQSGMPDLVLGDLATDGSLIEEARDLAKRMLAADPRLQAPWAERLREELGRRSRAVGFREVI